MVYEKERQQKSLRTDDDGKAFIQILYTVAEIFIVYITITYNYNVSSESIRLKPHSSMR